MTTTTTSIATNIIHQPRSVLDNPFASECYPTVHSVCLYTLLHATLIIVPWAEHIHRSCSVLRLVVVVGAKPNAGGTKGIYIFNAIKMERIYFPH